MSISAKTIYLNAGGSGLWDQAGALFVAEISGSKYSMTKVTGSYYEADVPDAATKVKFLRNDPTTGNTWNNTDNLTIPDGKNCYTITGWSYGNWSTYTYDPLATDVFLAGQMNGWSTTANEFRKANAGDANGTISMILEAGSYEFKVVRNGTWTSHNGTFSSSVSGKTFSSSVNSNTTMNTTIHGEYTFTWAISSSQLSITYPTLCAITANANDVAMGSVTGAGEFGTGLTATLTAITNDGYVFVNWTKGGEIVSTDATYSFKVTETVDLVANFEEAAEEVHNVTISYLCNETTVKENGIVAIGVTTTQEVTAPSVTGYQFTNWTIGAGIDLKAGTASDATITVVTKSASSDYTLVANYEEVMETVYFINAGNWEDVHIHLWNGTATDTEWPGTKLTATGTKIGKYDVYESTAQQGAHANLLFHKKDDDSKKTADLTWAEGVDKYYIHNYNGNTGWYTQAEAEALLVVIPDYYITGTIAGGWNGNEVKMTYSGDIWSHTFSASALTIGTEYKLKVTDGTWENHWSTINGTIEGVSNDGDGNVCFKLSTVGDVTVTFDGAKITVSTTGAFYVPTVYDYYIVGSMNSWNQTDENYGMSKVGETTTYSKELNLAAGTYEFKVKKNGGDWFGEYEGDYKEVSYKDGNIQIVLTAATNVTIKIDSETKKITFEGLTEPKYYIVGTFNSWTTDDPNYEMTLEGGVYKKEVTFAKDVEFKVCDGTWSNHWGKDNLGGIQYNELTENEDNIKMKEAKTFTVIFNPAENLILFEGLTEKVTYVLMGVNGDWDNGIELTPNPKKAGEYMLLAQTIAKATDAVKIVKIEGGDKTQYCQFEDVKDGSVTCTEGTHKNILLEDGIYNFYYTTNDNKVYIETSTPAHTRTVPAGYYATVCLPNNIINVVGATLFEVAGKEGNKVIFDEVLTPVAGMPYIFLAEENTISFYCGIETAATPGNHESLHGTFEDMVDADLDGMYMVQNNKIVKCAATGCNIPANRAYFNGTELESLGSAPAPMPGRRRITMGAESENTATGVEGIIVPEGQTIKVISNGQLIIIRNGEMYNAQGQKL